MRALGDGDAMTYVQKELARLNAVAIAAKALYEALPPPRSRRLTEKWDALRAALRALEPGAP